MLPELASGFLLGILLAAPPGPVMAIMATAATRGRTLESLRTAWGAMTGDAVWLGLVALGFVVVLEERPVLIGVLGMAGAALLLWMAWGTFKGARAGIGESAVRGSYRLGFFTILTSPFSLAWWLGNGGVLLSKWGFAGCVGLFGGLFVYTLAFTFGMRWAGAKVRWAALAVAWASVALLSAFAVWVAWTAVGYLRPVAA